MGVDNKNNKGVLKLFNPDLLNEIRERFHHVDSCPFQGERIFFENAGGALTLKSVVQRSTELAAIPDNQGRDNPASKALVGLINQARADIHCFFGAPEGTAFVGESGTELLFRIIGTALLGSEKSGNVVGSTLEHPATTSACKRWSAISNHDFINIPHNNETASVSVDDYRPHITEDTRVAIILHTSPVTGMSVDVAAIASMIRQKSPQCYIIVDGIQHAAHGGIDISNYDIDAYVISPYKVFSRHGYGVAWLSKRLARLPHNQLIGSAKEAWDMGTRDTAAFATFTDVVDYFDWLGSKFTNSNQRRTRIEAAGKAIHQQEKALTDAMLFGVDGIAGLDSMESISVIGGINNPLREGLVSLVVRNKTAETVVSELSQEGIRTHARKNDYFSGNILTPLKLESCVRVSLCHYNSLEEVKKFLTVIKKIAGD